MTTVADYFRLVKFSHSIFALPFALSAAWLAAGGPPSPRVLLLVVVCAVSARTAAMAFNRLVDRDIDAANARTRGRELPRGRVTPRATAWLVVASSAVFTTSAFALNAPCGWLSVPVLGVLLGYSFAKRVTWLAHGILGAALACAPLGAWLAVRGEVGQDSHLPVLLALAVLVWVAGFDLIYASQDADFDRSRALFSVPARFGVAAALQGARVLHVVFVLLLVGFGAAANLGWPFHVAVIAVILLLGWQHSIVSPGDLSRADGRFFTLNGWVSVLLFVGVAIDLAARGGAP